MTIARADGFIEWAHAKIDLLICTFASRDLIVSFQGLSQRRSTGAMDKRSGKGPAGLETTSLAARNPLNIGAPGRT